jgi:HSP20 family protein
MLMAQWRPFEDVDALRREIDRAFEGFGLRTEPSSRAAFLPGQAARRYPLVNLFSAKDTLYVEALAPGVEAGSFNLTVTGNTLTISGEKRTVHDGVKADAFHRNERAAGRFVRTVELPVEVDEGKVSADYKNGLLLVALPKAEKAKPKQISVRVS